MFLRFNHSDFHSLCDQLGQRDPDLQQIINRYGYPPFWSRPNTFESLLHIILEQQVSLASALATLNKLKARIKKITPAKLLTLSDEELRACYFSRQKTVYARALAEAIVSKKLSLSKLAAMDEPAIREQLTGIKGIGQWTTDIYLIFILKHTDVFPTGDLAAVNAFKKIKGIQNKDAILPLAEKWRPYRSIAVMLLWHFYLEERKPVQNRLSK